VPGPMSAAAQRQGTQSIRQRKTRVKETTLSPPSGIFGTHPSGPSSTAAWIKLGRRLGKFRWQGPTEEPRPKPPSLQQGDYPRGQKEQLPTRRAQCCRKRSAAASIFLASGLTRPDLGRMACNARYHSAILPREQAGTPLVHHDFPANCWILGQGLDALR
jgi:hypothetical protein